MAIEDILANDGSNELGLAPVMYLVKKSDISTFPAYTSTPSTNAQKVTRSGSTFSMVSSAVFKAINLIPKKGNLKVAVGGGEQMNATETTYEFETSGLDASKYGFMQECKNLELVAVVKDRNGLQVILGDEIQGCYFTKLESSVDKERGIKGTITYSGKQPAVWAGTPPLV